MGTATSVISVQFKKEEDSDDVAPPSQPGAPGSAESSSDPGLTNEHAFHSRKKV